MKLTSIILATVLVILAGFSLTSTAAAPKKRERLPPINEPHPRLESPDIALEFTTLGATHNNLPLEIEGQIPSWVDGVLIKNGFAQFESDAMRFTFLFDVAGGLYRFKIQNGTVRMTSRFLESEYWQYAQQNGIFPDTLTFGDTEPPSKCDIGAGAECLIHDNLQVDIWKIGSRHFATSDFASLVEFDPITLQYKGVFNYNDSFNDPLYTISCAHPSLQPDGSGYFIHYLGKLDLPTFRRNTYEFYRVKDTEPGSTRELIVKIESPNLAYVHSFAVTENYIIFAEFPIFYDLLSIPITRGPLIDLLQWKPEQGTKVWVINHKTGQIVKQYTTEAFFSYHHINAFENEKGDVFMDITAFDDPSHLFKFNLDIMRQGPQDYYPCSNIRRYSVPVGTGGEISYTVAHPVCHDLPRINDNYHAKPYRYVYAAGEYTEGDWYNAVIKMDLNDPTGTTLTWAMHNNFGTEPVFLPRPGATEEDDGLVLSVVLDGDSKRSFLVFLDGQTFEEVARAYAPVTLPFMSHGEFYWYEK